jgi:carbonic anhydrase
MLLKQKGLFDMAIELNELTRANETFAAGFDQGGLAMPPARKLAVVTCMDARLEPLSFLGLRLGDAHVIRNAGGRATPDAIRSLVISQQLLGTETVLVIHHTDCGMLTFQNEDLRGILKERLGVDAHKTAAEIDFLPFGDLPQSVRDDVAAIKSSPLFPKHIPVYGFIYDVRSGQVQRVE